MTDFHAYSRSFKYFEVCICTKLCCPTPNCYVGVDKCWSADFKGSCKEQLHH